MAQTAAAIRIYETNPAEFQDLPMKASTTIYAGAAVGEDSSTGTYRMLAGLDNFAGFAQETVVSGATGTTYVRVRTRGYIRLAVATASAVADNGDPVYASDSETFTKVSTLGTQIGKIYRWIVSTSCIVYFEALSVRSI